MAILGPNSLLAINLKYEEVSGRNFGMTSVHGVKDASLGNTAGVRKDTIREMGIKRENSESPWRILRRAARGVLNSTTPYPTTDSGNSTVSSQSVKATIKSTLVPPNKTETSDHIYYKSRFIEEGKYFEDLKALYDARNQFVVMRDLTVSDPDTIRYTARDLNFSFPFYGHLIKRLIVTSAGFLHIGPIFHRFSHDVHYVAPLMGGFYSTTGGPIISYIYDDGQKFMAQWESIYEGGANKSQSFTFQVTLLKNGTIIFAYKTIPYSLNDFISKDFPPKIGLSDGFVLTEYYNVMVNGVLLRIPVRTVYKYHTVSLEKGIIKSNSAFILTPVLNCVQASSCEACFDAEVARNFKCKWCGKLQLCSDKFDWYRQEWTRNGCDKNGLDSKAKCQPMTTPHGVPSSRKNRNMIKSGKSKGKRKGSFGVVIGVLVCVILIFIAGVLFYGYRNPNSRIGMLMIQYRPSKLARRFRR